jgi:hypothetical protein
MFLACELEALTGCSVTWKRSVTPHGRSWWVLVTSEPRTAVTGYGLWLTATASEYGSQSYPEDPSRKRPSLQTMAKWPTATAGDANPSGSRNLPGSAAHPGTSLTDATVRQWATPMAQDAENAGSLRKPYLTNQARPWPSPGAHDDKNIGQNTPGHSPQLRHLPGLLAQGSHSTHESRPASSLVLNPAWVATLMGFPPDYFRGIVAPSSKPSEMPSSRKSSK